MNEPKYDEDLVTLGYLKKMVDGTSAEVTYSISKHYATKPSPPYKVGDTWTDGNVIYTCIKSREIGVYTDSDWVTESGAKQEAEDKNKVYLTQPSNYRIGDMWILQTDNDHKAGKKGEILIAIAGRSQYNEDDWINMLGYGSITSINEVASNLNKAINRVGVVEEAIEDGIIITFYQDTVPEGIHIGDLWFVTGNVDNYIEGKIYRYNGTIWEILNDPAIEEAFAEANEARIVADGKIQSFYSPTEPAEGMGVGDLWINTADNNKLHRYNGTNWVAVYDTRVDDAVTRLETVETLTVSIQTDLGKITQTVNKVVYTVEKTITNVDVMYALSDSSTEAPTTGWSTEAPQWENGKYMWQKTVTTYGDETIKETEPTCISGAKGEKGDTGERGLQGLQGPQGEQGIPGPKGDSGEDGAQGPQGEKGDKGDKGDKGEDGADGINGKTSYFHIKYSAVENPTSSSQISETPNTYIGTYVDFNQTDSTNPSDYTWSRFKGLQGEKGENGIPGTNGEDGKTSYLHIAYATNSTGTSGFSTTDSTNKTYIGQYTDFTQADSTDPSKYNWTLIKGDRGEQGIPGQDGATGNGIKTITNYYLATSSGSNVTINTSGWTTTIQTITETKKYLWNYEKITYTDNSVTTTTPCIIGVYGNKGATGEKGDKGDAGDKGEQGEKGDTGAKGDTGNGIQSIQEYYQVSTSNVTAPTSWVTSVPTLTATNKYLWNYERITYTDGTSKDTAKRVIGVYGDKGATGAKGDEGEKGDKGDKGDTGIGVEDIEEQYYLSTSNTTQTGGSWKNTQDPWTPEKYIWTRNKITWTDGTVTHTTPVLAEGINNANSAVNDLENVLANDYYTKEETTASVNIKSNEVATDVTSSVTASILTLLNNGYLTAEQVEALVEGNTEEIATIKSQVEQTVTDEDMQIAISTALEGGVSYLKNTLFTINAEGLWIATSQDEFNAKYDNTGMYLYSYSEMIAKYTKDGAELKNLKVNGEIETGNLRIMDVVVDGEKRTHIHWIGG